MQKRKINKVLTIIGVGLILSSTLSITFITYNKYKDIKYTEETIIKEFINNDYEEKKNISKDSKEKGSNVTLNNDYLGYIEFSNIKRLITNGTDKKILDKDLVGVLKSSASLDDMFGNTILAGHNKINVFKKLHKIKQEDEIKIVTHKGTYKYVVKEIISIRDDDFSYFKQTSDKRIITLVTCKSNNRYRLIVIAELKEVKYR